MALFWRPLSTSDFRDENNLFDEGWEAHRVDYPGGGTTYDRYHVGEFATKEDKDRYMKKAALLGPLVLLDVAAFAGLGTAVGFLVGVPSAVIGAGIMYSANKEKKAAARREEERQRHLQRRQASSEVWQPELDNNFAARFCLGGTHNTAYSSRIVPTATLCQQCALLLDSNPDTSRPCDVCTVASGHQGTTGSFPMEPLRKVGGFLQLGDGTRLLRLLSDPQQHVRGHADFQIGIPLPQLSRERGPEASGLFRLIRAWLKDCDDHHDCRKHVKSRFTPKRLIDTQSLGSPERLALTTAKRVDYAVLSHSWGTPTQDEKVRFCTHVGNIQQRTLGFNLSDLPQTFQDAVAVTRQLGMRYLWIDSVCLIQDTIKSSSSKLNKLQKEDMEEGIKTMGKIYASAYCTLAASSSKSSKDGFLSRREVPGAMRVIRQNPYGGPSVLYLSKDTANFEEDVTQGPLNQRAWVLQERVLSRRTIHFTSKQIYWECGEFVRSDNFTKLGVAPGREYFIQDPNFPARLRSAGVQRTRNFLVWLFTQYAQRGITYEPDRLHAISGLTTRVKKVLGEGTNYGVFGFCLHRLLLWKRVGGNQRPAIDYGDVEKPPPSWSWMAYPGAIEFMVPDRDDLKIAAEEDLFIKGDGRRLKVSVRLLRKCEDHEDAGNIREEGTRRIVGEFWADDPSESNTKFDGCVVVGHDKDYALGENPEVYVIFVRYLPDIGIRSYYSRVGVGKVEANSVRGWGSSAFLV